MSEKYKLDLSFTSNYPNVGIIDMDLYLNNPKKKISIMTPEGKHRERRRHRRPKRVGGRGRRVVVGLGVARFKGSFTM